MREVFRGAYRGGVPAYAYRCRACDATFEVTRSVHDATTTPVPCPQGHADTSRVFTPVAVGGGAPAAAAPAAPSGGCCGGGCCG